jgi:hypothetical protein
VMTSAESTAEDVCRGGIMQPPSSRWRPWSSPMKLAIGDRGAGR